MKEVSIIEALSYLFVPYRFWFFFKKKIIWRKAGAVVVIMVGMMVFYLNGEFVKLLNMEEE